MEPIRVIIFEDNETLRGGLALLLDTTAGMKCTGAFPDCSDLEEKIESSDPNVILMDIDMPGMNGIEAVKEIHMRYPHILNIMHTVFDDETRILQAICNGAVGYLLKGSANQKIWNAVKEATNGGSPMSPGIARKVTLLLSSQHAPSKEAVHDTFTPREKEVLRELSNGKSYKMIADTLQISLPTVNTHIRKIYEKLQVNSIQEAVAKAIRAGLV